MLPPALDMVRQLIATPSVSSPDDRFDQSNRGVIDIVAEWAAELGFVVRIEALPGDSGKANLIATLGEGDDGLVLSGHTDTVPYNAERWTDDPFVLTERDGKLHGLGTADMKGFFAAALHAIGRFEPGQLQRPITLLGTADEESTMDGARALAERGERLGRYAIIGEPTGLVPIRKHKGVFYVQVTVGGKAGHASNPALGVNAIDGLHLVLAALQSWRDEIGKRYRDDDFEVPTPTLNFGRITGGDSPNRICAECKLVVDIRLVPGMERSAVVAELRDVVGDALRSGSWTFNVRAVGGYADAFSGPTDAEFCSAVETLCGCSAKAALFGTEAPFLAELGLQTLVLGAGDIAVAHQPDEYVTIAAIERATDVYANLIQRFCIESA
ncbi:MAG: acetylornithine deacetylase [Deltaproteobacteria bacterium]|nr:acetylornithine deacetylase [Deltaproteobacteria bacterium]MBW2214137.1 acetylornithine deacetylase [Deltaproteobacteria bacterium]